MRKFLSLLLASALVCLLTKDAAAAFTPVPPGQDLDAQAERFRQEYSMEKRARDQIISRALIETEEKESTNPSPGVSFVLYTVHVTGATIFDPKKLSFIWKPYLGEKVNFIDLNNIVKMIKRVYKDLGYLTTTAYLPPQDVKEGVVEIRVVEGKRGNLSVDGNKWFSTPSIEKYFHTYRGEVMDMGEVQKDLMRLNNGKDLNVTSVLTPGQDPQTVDVTLKAQENAPYHVSVGTDNQGSRLTGRYRRLVDLSDNNLTGNEDSLAFNGAYTDLSSGYYLAYQTPVGTEGIKLGIDGGYFQGKLGDEYKPFDIINYSEFFDPNASYEIYQSDDAQVDVRSGIQIKHINKMQSDRLQTSENLRLPYIAMDGIKNDSWGQTSFSPELGFSMPGFIDGSKADNIFASRGGDVDGQFTKYIQYLTRTQNMFLGSYMQIRSQFQAASHTLPTSEQFQLGGESSIRGYPEGDYLADIGWDLDTDWYFPMYLIPASAQYYGTPLRNDIQPFIFYDMGGGKLITVNSGERKSKFLSGVGAGIRFQLKKNVYLKLEWAVPTGEAPTRGTGPSTFDVSFEAGT